MVIFLYNVRCRTRIAGGLMFRTLCELNRLKSIIKEQGYNSSLSVLRLSKAYSEARLETACELALTKVRMPRYHHLKTILSSNQDKIFLANKQTENKGQHNSEGYVRGPEYYGGKK